MDFILKQLLFVNGNNCNSLYYLPIVSTTAEGNDENHVLANKVQSEN